MRLSLVLDCADPETLSEFWTAALGYSRAWSGGAYVVLTPSQEGFPIFLLQRVEEPKTGKNRMHLDIHAGEPEEQAERLVALGAKRLSDGVVSEHGVRWIVMADPEGNEFCVCHRGA